MIKQCQDKQKLDQMMNLTFPHRRQLLVTDIEKLATITETYPVLCEEKQVRPVLQIVRSSH